jgi:hypothetical protein
MGQRWGESPPNGVYEKDQQQLQPLLEMVRYLNQDTNPLGHDKYMCAFFTALEERILDPEQDSFRYDLIHRLLKPTNGEPPKLDMAIQKLERATHKPALTSDWQSNQKNPRFPEDFTDKDSYHKLWDYIYQGGDIEDEFGYDLWIRELTTNISQRYVFVPLVFNILRLAEGRFPEPPKILDVGASQNKGLKKLGLQLPFEIPKVMRGREVEQLEPDHNMSQFIGRILTEKEFKIGTSTGLDKVNMFDSKAQEWSYACYRPGEYTDEALMLEHEILSNTEAVSNVNFIDLDITDFQAVKNSPLEPQSYDAVVTSMSWYEIASSPRRAANAYRSIQYLRKPDGLFMRHEFAWVDNLGNLRLYPFSYGGPYRCITAVNDALKQRKGGGTATSQFFSWRGGRGDEMKIEDGALDLIMQGVQRGSIEL